MRPPRGGTRPAGAIAVLAALGLCSASLLAADPYGLDSQPEAKPFLNMPKTAEGEIPHLLSQTGAFKNTPFLVPNKYLVPYDLNVAFWSDGASKARWIALPNDNSSKNQKIKFAPEGEWTFPDGTVFVKHFDLATDETHPQSKRRLETRLLVRDSTGSVYGVTYKWRADNSDAELLATNLTEQIPIKTASGWRTQSWYYPSRQDCRVCHTDKAGGVLGVKTRQLNRPFAYPNGVTDNELRAWNHIGIFNQKLNEADWPSYPSLACENDASRTLEDRARSYLDANCAHCHRPGGTVAYFDARYDTPLARQGLVGGQVLIDQGVDGAAAIAPNDIWRSLIFMRVNTLEAIKMPPLAHEALDEESIALLRQWITSMPGTPVLAPPVIGPRGGEYAKAIEVTLTHSEPGATIRYTTDGSSPTRSDPAYNGPIKLKGPTIVRARAFKPGFTKSITVQEVFVIGE